MEGLSDLERYLTSADVLDIATFEQHGAHQSYRVLLAGGVAVLGKPADQAPEGGVAMVRNEAAAWDVAKLLGWPDLMATTVTRVLPSPTQGTDTEFSLQVLWPQFDVGFPLEQLPDDDIWRGATFDVLVLHSDRHGGNWGAVPCGGVPRLKLVDHGYAFWAQRGLASALAGLKMGEELPDDHRDAVSLLGERCSDSKLPDLLGEDRLSQLLHRAEHLAATGVLDLPSG